MNFVFRKKRFLPAIAPGAVMFLIPLLLFGGCGREKEEVETADESRMEIATEYGTADDLALADSLWKVINNKKSGYRSWKSWKGAKVEMVPGRSPHGAFLKTFVSPKSSASAEIPLDAILVKENFSEDKKTMVAITAMWRLAGYDPDNFDWFWAKYNPDGSLDSDPHRVKLAGRIGKGTDTGCVSCHAQSKGEDLVFTN
jgi:hypothetical protein